MTFTVFNIYAYSKYSGGIASVQVGPLSVGRKELLPLLDSGAVNFQNRFGVYAFPGPQAKSIYTDVTTPQFRYISIFQGPPSKNQRLNSPS